MKKKKIKLSRLSGSKGFVKTIKDFGNYFSADMATKALGFLSIPVYTRLISVADYGIYNVFLSYLGIFAVVLSFNSYASVGRYYYEENNDFKSFFGTTIIFTSIIFTINSLIFILVLNQISSKLNLSTNILILIIPIAIFQICMSFFKNINAPQRNSLKISKVSLFNAYSTFGIAVIILLFMTTRQYRAPIYASITVGILITSYIIIDLKKYIKITKPSFKHIKYILNYSIPLIPYILGGVILAQLDRIMINSINGSKETGIYSLAYNIGMIIHAVESALFTAWMPDYFKHMNNKNYKERDKDILRILKIIIFASIGLTYFAVDLGQLLASKKFHEGLGIIPIIVFGYVWFAIFRIYGDYPFYRKKTYWLSIMFFTSGILNIFLNKIFLPKYGYVAGAYTTVASYAFLAVFAIWVAKYPLKIKITPLSKIIFPIAIYIISLIIYFTLTNSTVINNLNFFIFFIIKGLIVATLGFILLRENIKKFLSNA